MEPLEWDTPEKLLQRPLLWLQTCWKTVQRLFYPCLLANQLLQTFHLKAQFRNRLVPKQFL